MGQSGRFPGRFRGCCRGWGRLRRVPHELDWLGTGPKGVLGPRDRAAMGQGLGAFLHHRRQPFDRAGEVFLGHQGRIRRCGGLCFGVR